MAASTLRLSVAHTYIGLSILVGRGRRPEMGLGSLNVGVRLAQARAGRDGRDDDRGALVETADQVEQQLSAGLGERQIGQFVEDDEVETREIVGEASLAAGAGLGFEAIDEIDGVEEPPSGTRSDAASRDGDRQVGPPTPFARGVRDADGLWRKRRICPAARRSTRHRS